ncbi:MAG: hypothetical protein AAFV33_12360, partial [Chloroflexota bacterium]
VFAARRRDALLLYLAWGLLGGALVAASAAIMDAAARQSLGISKRSLSAEPPDFSIWHKLY